MSGDQHKKCANPRCCGSDGVDCCIPECEWSPWHWLIRLIDSRIKRAFR